MTEPTTPPGHTHRPDDFCLAITCPRGAWDAALAELRAKVEAMKADTSDLSGGTFFWGTRAGINHAIDAVLALLDPV